MTRTFSGFLSESDDQKLVTEAFNSNPYDLTFGKKSAGDIFFTFHDEDDKEFRIQFYTPQGLGKNVRQVFIGTKKGASYLDSQQKFKNPMRVAATMIDATKQFLDTPIGKGIDGFAINFSKKVMDRGIALLPKIIRQSGLKQKLNVMDLKYSPDDSRGFVWVVRKGKDPAQVFDGPKMKGITWDDPDKVGDIPVQQTMGSGVGTNAPEETPEKVKPGFDTTPAGAPTVRTFNEKPRGQYIGPDLKTSGYTRGIYSHKKTVESGGGKLTMTNTDFDVTMQIWFGVDGKPRQNGLSDHTNYLKVRMIDGLRDSIGANYNYTYKSPQDFTFTDVNTGPDDTIYTLTSEVTRVQATDKGDVVINVHVHLNVKPGATAEESQEVSVNLGNNGTELDGITLTARYVTQPDGKVQVQTIGTKAGKVVFNAVPYMLPDASFVKKSMEEFQTRGQNVVKQLQLANSSSYNPNKVKLPAFSLSKGGDILFGGRDLSQSAYRNLVLDTIVSLDKKQDNADKVIADLNNMTSSGREVDWQIRKINGGFAADWDITFRRNTQTGAYMENKADIGAANSALNRMQAYMQNLGYKTQVFLMSLDDAKMRDQTNSMNSDDPYSEYEQSFGGTLRATK